jgi:teichoic acid transport system permease protein
VSKPNSVSSLNSETELSVFRPFHRGIPNLRIYIRDLIRRKSFITEMSRVERELEHLDTFFGKLWSVISPLLSAVVYYLFIFIIQGAHQGAELFLHLMAGIFVLEFISTAASRGAFSIVSATGLINNTKFPRVAIPLTQVLTAWRIFIPSLGVYAVFHIALGQSVSWAALQAIPALLMILLFSAGIAMFAATAQIYFRDTGALLPFILRLLLFASPVLYFPEQAKALLGGVAIAAINPIFCMVEIFSGSLARGATFDIWTWLIALSWSLFSFLFGFFFLIRREGEFAARL